MNVTVSTLGSQSQQRFRINTRLRQRSGPMWWIAQGDQPITGDISHATARERTVALMQPAWGNLMVVPNRKPRHHTAGQAPMDSQVGAQDTVPVLNGTAGAHGPVPGGQQRVRQRSPVRRQALQQLLAAGTQDSPALPRPAHQV